MITDDGDEIDKALEEAFTKQEVNEVHKEPEIELPKVTIKMWILPTVSIISFNVSYENLMLHQGRNSLLMIVLILITFCLKVFRYGKEKLYVDQSLRMLFLVGCWRTSKGRGQKGWRAIRTGTGNGRHSN